MSDYIQVITTTPDRDMAESVAQSLLENRLAACVQITEGVSSYYWWDGKIDSSNECVCTIKTGSHLYEAVEKKIREIHSYDVPEIIAVPITAGSKEYLDWIDKETGSEQ
jgi:periplasmic divalent cation tolerance protein